MKHDINSFGNEIVEQILISELCFEVCNFIPGYPGLGSHFLPYFYNLNFQKGLSSLHSLLLSCELNELSLKNYIKLYKEKNPDKDISIFIKNVKKISEDFKIIAPFRPRNKVGAHLDGDFTHVDFTCGYLMLEILKSMIEITQQLKEIFFPFVKYSISDNLHKQLIGQIYQVVDKFTIEEAQKIINRNKLAK